MADTSDDEKFYDSGPVEALPAPPPPPPPPPTTAQSARASTTPLPRKSPGDTDVWMRKTIDEIKSYPLPPGVSLAPTPSPQSEIARQLTEHRAWLERLEREIGELKSAGAQGPVSAAVPVGVMAALDRSAGASLDRSAGASLDRSAGASLAEPTPEPLDVEDARLRAEMFSLRSELERNKVELEKTRAELERTKAEPRGADSTATDLAAVKVQLNASDKALDAVRAELRQVTAENERLEGELQSLRLKGDGDRERVRAAVSGVTDLKLDPKAEGVVRQIVVDRDRLQEEKTALEKDLTRLKSEATKRLASLKGEVEKITKQSDTIRLQKENLLRQLQERDARGLGEPTEITLEDITNSDVFKQMLGNIRRTSRAEVTTLHEAIASLRGIDPRAYEVVLEVCAKAFQKAQIENPLATLPRP